MYLNGPSPLRKGQLLITQALLGHYHAELHEAEAPPEVSFRMQMNLTSFADEPDASTPRSAPSENAQ